MSTTTHKPPVDSSTRTSGPTSDVVYRRALSALDVAQAGLSALDREIAVSGPTLGVTLSVVIPVFNERDTITQVVDRVQRVVPDADIIVVDDCSTDGTRDVLIDLAQRPGVRVIMHGYNKGKGAALRSGFELTRGQVILIQDADLEYDPADYARLVAPIADNMADVVFGSRFLEHPQQDPSWLHRFGNRVLTMLSNATTGLRLTDMETCYKVFRRGVLRGMDLHENRFGFEPEFTAKIARRRCRVREVAVSYASRNHRQGKKIGLRDAFRALYCIVRYAKFD